METQVKFDFATVALDDAFTAFWHSRKAKNVSQIALEFHSHTAVRFVSWLKENGVCSPEVITTQHVGNYLASVSDRGVADNTIHGHTRAVLTLLVFKYDNKFINKRVKYDGTRRKHDDGTLH